MDSAYELTPEGMRAMIEAFEFCLGYEPIDTAKMKDKQLLHYFNAMREKADIDNHPSRMETWKNYVSHKFAEAMIRNASNN